MIIELEKVIPTSFIASLGAPIIYVGIIFVKKYFISKQLVDLSLVGAIFLSSLLMSLLITISVTLIVILICNLLGITQINFAYIYVLVCIVAIVPVVFISGVNPGAILYILISANFVVYWLVSRIIKG